MLTKFYSDQDCVGDATEEVRCSGIPTLDIDCWGSRHYEAESVVAQVPDGSWVGWTYWTGGGKAWRAFSGSLDGRSYHVDCVKKKSLLL